MSNNLKFAVLGNPIDHSLSPQIHQLFASSCNIKLSYTAIEVPKDNFAHFVKDYFNTANGANVTLPFKQQAAQLVEQISARAALAQAVNTISKLADGSLYGDNTDGLGLVNDLSINLAYKLTNKTILIIGAGGAAKGVLAPLLATGPQQIYLTNRTYRKAQDLATQFTALGNIKAVKLTEFKTPVDLIINASSASLNGELPTINSQIIQPQVTCCYDMMYSQLPTIFNQWAQHHQAAQTWDGFGMLVEQAAAAFNIWLAVKPNSQALMPQLRQLIRT